MQKKAAPLGTAFFLSMIFDFFVFFIREYPRLCDEMLPFNTIEGKVGTRTFSCIKDQLSMLPILVLAFMHIKRGATECAEQNVGRTYFEISFSVAHRGRAVTAAAGLIKHDGPMNGFNGLDELKCRICGHYAFGHA